MKYQCSRKINFKEIFDFQRVYLTKSKCRPSLESLQNFIMTPCLGTWPCWSNNNPCHSPGHSVFQLSVSENKPSYLNDFILSESPNNLSSRCSKHPRPGFNFFEFLANVLSATSYSEFAKHR